MKKALILFFALFFKDAENKWTQDGFTPDKKMYFYCGGGARSALYTFYAYMMGWPAANYEGGWFLWSTDYNNGIYRSPERIFSVHHLCKYMEHIFHQI